MEMVGTPSVQLLGLVNLRIQGTGWASGHLGLKERDGLNTPDKRDCCICITGIVTTAFALFEKGFICRIREITRCVVTM